MAEFDLESSFQELKSKISSLCAASGRPIESVSLLAVSKGQSQAKIRDLARLGQRDFGENYAQELIAKSQSLESEDLRWHFIGKLQSNKIRKLVDICSSIQTVASWKHAAAIARVAKELDKSPYPVWINTNAGEEEQKAGISIGESYELAARIEGELPELRLLGILAIPPAKYRDIPESMDAEIPEIYLQLRALADRIGERQLSLGMSGDLGLAIRAGSNQVRIGSALLGERNYDQPPAAT